MTLEPQPSISAAVQAAHVSALILTCQQDSKGKQTALDITTSHQKLSLQMLLCMTRLHFSMLAQ
eukprot:5176363-Amphidinium_carterae.1